MVRSYCFSKKFLAGVLVAGLAMGASAPAQADQSDVGLLVGAGLGGLLGNQFGGSREWNAAATGIGVFAGGLMGRSIGQSMDRADRGYRHSGYSSVSYYNHGYAHPRRHYHYSRNVYHPTYVAPPVVERQVVYVRDTQPVYVQQGYVGGTNNSGRYCREYQSNVQVGSTIQSSYGTACMQPDGSWEVQ